ncbi:mxaK protein [Paraburkholderia fungorum]|uniref:MxaK protein n=1 Tax=Paraburkholderia fungorum TaxID=134537 RepID=A0A1H1JCZ5_9BURK|nr:tetratricopeptide repeat protein [Paraburkholderia fungorum]SDR47857.1 mxaK protein [Paraburkholderia fungorum]
MTRTFIHAIFATLALVCAGFALYDGIQLRHAVRVNREIAAAGADARENPSADEAPQVLLARATALSKAGHYDSAARIYESLIHDYPDDLGRIALFDLGNMYLREGRGDGAAHGVRSLAMIGEAKTRYRLLLRVAPDDWNARYNLERALWLAPETPVVLDKPDVKEQHNVKLRGAQSQDLP